MIEERLNGPGWEQPEEEEPTEERWTLFPKAPRQGGEENFPPRRRQILVPSEPSTPVVPTLNLLEQMQRELTGDESVGLGFARAYALASELTEREPDFKRYILNDTLYYDFETDSGYDIELIEAQDCGEVINENWLVLTDEEANARARDYIEESLWAFNASFLAGQTGLPEAAFAGLSAQCESGNEPIRQMIQATCGIESLVEAAISADGRGHWLASYDHEEREFNNGRMTFFIYRIN